MRLSEKTFTQKIALLASTLTQQVELDDGSFILTQEAQNSRTLQVEHDFSFFRKTYFHHYIKGIYPRIKATKGTHIQGSSIKNTVSHKHTCSKNQTPNTADLHLWLDIHLPKAIDKPKGQRLAIAAPRGEAKSTIVALCFVLWTIFTKRKKYILLIADTTEQAQILLEAIKHELTTNPWLHYDFPDYTGEGILWNAHTILTNSHVKIQALGAGKRMRGLRHGPYRPDLIILDDLENDQQVRKPEQRDKLQNWLQKTVMNLGSADGSMDIIYIGTVLHYDAVLARTLTKPLWKTCIFKAIKQWPERMDLWDQWETLLLEQGIEKAQDFLNTHHIEMHKGTAISWPGMRTLQQLMLVRSENHAAFDAEYQNDPLQGENAPFAQCIHYWSIPSEDWLYFGVCDPSLGKHGAGRDPSAILIGGFCKATVTLHVIEASIKKRHPDTIIEDIIAFHQQYTPILWGVEAIQFQEFFAHVLVQRAEQKGIALPVKPLINTTDKLLRIESLQPHMVQKHILLHPSQHELIQQLLHFPKADHDDGPDALEMLWKITTSGYISLQEAITPLSKEQLSENEQCSWR